MQGKITSICQHFKLPLEQILHVALFRSHSHLGFIHSNKLNSTRKGSWTLAHDPPHCYTAATLLSKILAWANDCSPKWSPATAAERQHCRDYPQKGPGRQPPCCGKAEPSPAPRQAARGQLASVPRNVPGHISSTSIDVTGRPMSWTEKEQG